MEILVYGDARMEIMEINGLEIRSTIPPSGYLVQGTEGQLNELKNIQSVESIHYVPAGLMIHSSLYDAPEDQSLVVEITGWKNSELVRHFGRFCALWPVKEFRRLDPRPRNIVNLAEFVLI